MRGPLHSVWALPARGFYSPPGNGFRSQFPSASALRGWHSVDGTVLPAQQRRCPRDLLLMQASQLQNIQRLDLWDAQCPDFPLMPRLTCLTLSFEAVTAHAMLPLPNWTVLEVLVTQGIGSCPSLSCLSRLTRNSLSANHLSGSTMYPVSADVLQSIKVCNACSAMSVCTDAFA